MFLKGKSFEVSHLNFLYCSLRQFCLGPCRARDPHYSLVFAARGDRPHGIAAVVTVVTVVTGRIGTITIAGTVAPAESNVDRDSRLDLESLHDLARLSKVIRQQRTGVRGPLTNALPHLQARMMKVGMVSLG